MQYGKVTTYASKNLKTYKVKHLTHDLELARGISILKTWQHHLYGISTNYALTQKILKDVG